MVMTRHAPHRIAALHRLLSSRSWAAINSVSPESDSENGRKN
jgi:hypothetical protein